MHGNGILQNYTNEIFHINDALINSDKNHILKLFKDK